MSSFHFYLQAARLQHAFMGATASFLLASLSGASVFVSCLAALVIALDVLGASLYYFAVANKMYALKKSSYLMSSTANRHMMIMGLIAMASAIAISLFRLSWPCVYLTVFNALVVVSYKDLVSKWWGSKNLLMAMVCTSPVLLGWWAGKNTHPQVPLASVIVFFAYLAREIIKDIQDREVDRGLRRTLVLQHDIGVARVMAGTALLAACYCLVVLLTSTDNYYNLLALLLATVVFGHVMFVLLFGRSIDEKRLSRHILLGTLWLIVAFACLRF